MWHGYRKRTLAMGDLFALDGALRHQEPTRRYLHQVAVAASVRSGLPKASSTTLVGKMLLSMLR